MTLRKAKYINSRERLVMLVVHLAGFVDLLIFVLSLGYITSDLRADVLFSEWADCLFSKSPQ